MTTPSRDNALSGEAPLEEFIEGVCTSDPFKVEKDFGQGYVKLRSTEAEKRQAAQDITCAEDIVIELLRNSRDAGASHIYLATSRTDAGRTMVILDDGCGVPPEMWEAVFEPRVTSKLETAHMDKWGMHGRGMALYSIKVNAKAASIIASEPDHGCCIQVIGGPALAEKTDQSTFPRFEEAEGVMAMRGPKNIIRTACEFALEHRKTVQVHVGTPAQVACALYRFGLATVPAYARAFSDGAEVPLIKTLGLANGPEDLASRARALGLDISLRTARRIIDGASEGLEDLASIMARTSFTSHGSPPQKRSGAKTATTKHPPVRLSAPDKERFLEGVMASFCSLADAYYLEGDVMPKLRVADGALHIEIPLTDRS